MSASVIICFSAAYAWSRKLTAVGRGESGGSTAGVVVSMAWGVDFLRRRNKDGAVQRIAQSLAGNARNVYRFIRVNPVDNV